MYSSLNLYLIMVIKLKKKLKIPKHNFVL